MEDLSNLRLQPWETGLPSPEDLTPLSQSLISPQLALAFGISHPNSRPHFDLNRAMHDDDSETFKRGDYYYSPDEAHSGSREEDNGLNRAVKRPRLVWTPKLHKRFVDVIEHLGVDKAVPKTIMEMMNVDGLTRENVASHLQKYRLYLKRMEGGISLPLPLPLPLPLASNDSHSSSRREPSVFDVEGFGGHLSMGTQQGLHCSSLNLMPMPMVPPAAAPGSFGGGFGHLGLNVGGSGSSSGFCGLESGAYSMFWNRQRG